MQNGPFGISSRATIFMAAYRNILWLHIELELLENVQLMDQDLLSAIKGKAKKNGLKKSNIYKK